MVADPKCTALAAAKARAGTTQLTKSPYSSRLINNILQASPMVRSQLNLESLRIVSLPVNSFSSLSNHNPPIDHDNNQSVLVKLSPPTKSSTNSPRSLGLKIRYVELIDNGIREHEMTITIVRSPPTLVFTPLLDK